MYNKNQLGKKYLMKTSILNRLIIKPLLVKTSSAVKVKCFLYLVPFKKALHQQDDCQNCLLRH